MMGQDNPNPRLFCREHQFWHDFLTGCRYCQGEEDRRGNENRPKDVVFPLSKAEAGLIYSELRTHTFNRHHPHYLYADSLLERMRHFIQEQE